MKAFEQIWGDFSAYVRLRWIEAYLGAPCGVGSSQPSIESFTTMAVQYLGTVFMMPALVPRHRPVMPLVS
jgi:hypothetical protein